MLKKRMELFCDTIIRVFSGKINNFDAITISMQHVLYMLLNYLYHDLGSPVMYEITTKLGAQESRSKNIYYVRFLILLANHVDPVLNIERPGSKFNCRVQKKRVLGDLVEMNLNNETRLVYPLVVQLFLSTIILLNLRMIYLQVL